MQKGSKDWVDYYKNKSKAENIKSLSYKLNKILLNAFQKLIIREISKKTKKILKYQDKVSILSAGSGIDFIANRLKKKFKNKVEVSILDISPECISQNRKLFGNKLKYITGDIFDYKTKNKFDIVYNTGLLEHFSKKEQKKIISNIKSWLKRPGYYITLNPYDGGKLYLKYTKIAKRKGIWEFGEETPIKSLKEYQDEDLLLIKEYPCCSMIQLSFLIYGNKLIFLILSPIILFFRFFYIKPIDNFFRKFIGEYGIISIFKNR